MVIQATATRTVNVVDTTAPVITLEGTNPMTVELGGTYSEPGAESNGGETVTITGSVDTDTLGSYTITYTATDANGNDRHSHKNSKCSRYYSPSNNS